MELERPEILLEGSFSARGNSAHWGHVASSEHRTMGRAAPRTELCSHSERAATEKPFSGAGRTVRFLSFAADTQEPD